MTDQDPVQESYGETRDLYGIATWERRTAFDAVAAGLYRLLSLGLRAIVVLLALAIFLSQIAIGGFAIVRDPALGALTGLSIVPAFVLAGYVWLEDPTLKQSLTTLVVTFLLGVLFAGFAAIVNTALEPGFAAIPLIGVALFFFLIVAPVEELVKWLAVRLYGYNRQDFRAVIDGAVLGAMAGLGFATIENALYITNVYLTASGTGPVIGAETLGVTSLRSLAGPGHVIYSSFAGYYLGLAKFNPENAGPIVVKGLLIATLIHGSYNTAVSYLPEVVPFPFAAFLAFVATHRRTFGSLFGSFTLLVMVAYGNFAWVPTFFIRNFGWTPAEAGSIYGTVVAVFGTGGALFGGWLASWFSARGYADAPYRATLLCSLPLVPLALLVYLVVPDGRWAAALYAPYQFFSAVPAGLAAAAMMTITPNEMRAKISSAYLFFSNFIGLSLGAATVGFITHNVFGDDARVGESLAIVNVLGIPLAVIAIWLGMKTYRDGVARLSTQ